jgi:hypothetical protein
MYVAMANWATKQHIVITVEPGSLMYFLLRSNQSNDISVANRKQHGKISSQSYYFYVFTVFLHIKQIYIDPSGTRYICLYLYLTPPSISDILKEATYEFLST